MEDRERELQRVEKPRLRTRTQFRPWPEVSRDDAGGPQSARLRLAHRARTARTTLAGRSRSGGQANQLLRPHPHVERLRNLSILAGLPPIPRHLLDPAGPHKSRRQPVNVEKVPTSRSADLSICHLAKSEKRTIVGFKFVESSPRQRAGSVRPSLFTPVGSKPTIGCEFAGCEFATADFPYDR